MQTINSTCPYCGVGCGISAKTDKLSDVQIIGDEQHPANFGRLCSKGSALVETLSDTSDDASHGARLIEPTIDGKGVSWNHATQTIADKISSSIEQYGSDSVAFYLSGQLLTEDYYVANKLMKGFIGTANVDTNSRLCMASAVVGYKRAFGADVVPCSYDDIDAAELIVLVGSNAAWTHPILYQRMVAAKQANPNLKVVLIDPRKTASCDIADLHLAIKPSSDGFLFDGLLRYLIDTESFDQDYIQNHTDGFAAIKSAISQYDLHDIAEQVSLEHEEMRQFFEWFAVTKNVVSFYSQGINQSATGSDKCNAIINCHLATGKIGYPGAGPFSITGQPNAMGGREVGGLANQLAAHMDFNPTDCDRVQRFWQSPCIASSAGLKAVDMFDAVADGRIKVIWIMATNPAVSLPNSNRVRAALASCPTVIVSDVTQNDTCEYADIILPAQGWSEKDGTVTNSERRISRQRTFRSPPNMAKPDWWALCDVAKKLGYGAHFDYQNAYQIFIEHCRLSGFENGGARAFDISGLSRISEAEYAELSPIQWPVNDANPSGRARMFEDGKFFTANSRAKFVHSEACLAQAVEPRERFYVLNSGRLRDQWHTMTRTGLAPSLSGHHDLPIVQINHTDATNRQIQDNQLLRLSNEHGEFIAAAKLTEDVALGELFCAIHWSEQFASKSVITSVFNSHTDPVSGQPELKAASVKIERYDCQTWARVASTQEIDKGEFKYWAQSKTKRGYITVLGSDATVDWRCWAERELASDLYFTQYNNEPTGTQSLLSLSEDSIELMIYSGTTIEELPSFAWLSTAFNTNQRQAMASLLRSEQGLQDSKTPSIPEQRVLRSLVARSVVVLNAGAVSLSYVDF